MVPTLEDLSSRGGDRLKQITGKAYILHNKGCAECCGVKGGSR